MMSSLMKSSNSDLLREMGNAEFKNSQKYNYTNAFIFYNLALLKAGSNKVKAALCYGNRSAVYMEMEYYDHCLKNIKHAEKFFPREKLPRLHERRDKCLKMISEDGLENDKMINPHRNPFKLSYLHNPKIPFFVNALQLVDDVKFGKRLITTRDLKAGDVIALISDPICIGNSRSQAWCCYQCQRINNFDLIASEECKHGLFCSEECMKKHIAENDEGFHQLEDDNVGDMVTFAAKLFMRAQAAFDGNIDEMRKFVDGNNNGFEKHTLFDFDWSNPDDPMYEKNMVLVLLGIEANVYDGHLYLLKQNLRQETKGSGKIGKYLMSMLKSPSKLLSILKTNYKKHGEFIEKVFEKFYYSFIFRNEFSIMQVPMRLFWRTCFFPARSLLHHSCNPNIHNHMSNDGKLMWIVNQPIPAGGQIFGGFYPVFYNEARPQPNCPSEKTCEPCKLGWQHEKKVSATLAYENVARFFYDRNAMKPPLNMMVDYFGQCCDDINKNYKGFNEKASVRKKIALKLIEARRCIDLIESPISQSFISPTYRF